MGSRDAQLASGSGPTKPALVFYPHGVKPCSGAQDVAAWIIHALQSDYEVTLLCQEADLEAANRRYGTSVDPRRVRIEIARSRFLLRIPVSVLRAENLRAWSLQ